MPRSRPGESARTRAEMADLQRQLREAKREATLQRFRNMLLQHGIDGFLQWIANEYVELESVAEEAVSVHNNFFTVLRDCTVKEEARRDQLHAKAVEIVESFEAEFGKHGTPLLIHELQEILREREVDAWNKPHQLTEEIIQRGAITIQEGVDRLLLLREGNAITETRILASNELRGHTKNPF